MSFIDGWAAMNLEMPARVPRTEYSLAEYHWPLVRKVTGLDVTCESQKEVGSPLPQAPCSVRAMISFCKAAVKSTK